MDSTLSSALSWNAQLNLVGLDGSIQYDRDEGALRAYFRDHVIPRTAEFVSLEDRVGFMMREGYYECSLFERTDFSFLRDLYDYARGLRHRFTSFLGAYKFYTSFALKAYDGQTYLEDFTDRAVMTALYLAQGIHPHFREAYCRDFVGEILTGRFQPATPTFLNAGKTQRGEMVSCFLLRVEDSMPSIARMVQAALELSKRGGGVAFCLTNIRESGAPIKKRKGQSSGLIPVMKILEDCLSFANQLGARQGAGAIYVNAHHYDIMKVLDSKRENADEKTRIKTLSIGVLIPDVTFEIAQQDKPMALFSPYDIHAVTGKPMSDIPISKHYYEFVDNPNIRKHFIKARDFFKTLAEIQCESGYPYIVFEDTVNKTNPIHGRISMSNLCSEILQVSEPSTINDDGSYHTIGRDISCNLGSLNVAKVLDGKQFAHSVDRAIYALTAVSDLSQIQCVPSVQNGNQLSHAIGLGQMNLHGFLAREHIPYGSQEALDFTNMYFYAVTYYALRASNRIAIERNQTFFNFHKSRYADGSYFDKYIKQKWNPKTRKVKEILKHYNVVLPTKKDWEDLKKSVMEFGLYNQNLQAIAPTGSISYLNHATSSIHPITAKVEIRKEAQTGRVYTKAPYLNDETTPYYQDAYEIGPEKIIDTYAEATKHVDQGLSLTLFFNDSITTREINKTQIYAWKKGIKTLYYIRIKQKPIKGTETPECLSCAL